MIYHWNDLRHSPLDLSTRLRLFVIAGTDSFFYYITDDLNIPCAVRGYSYRKKYHFFDKPLGYLNKLTTEDELLYADFEKVHIAVRGVPFTAFDPSEVGSEMISKRLTQVGDHGVNDEIFSELIDENLAIAFSLPSTFANEAHAWFSGAAIGHVISPLIKCFLDYSREFEGQSLLINTSDNLVEVIHCEEGRLHFVNHFRITGAEDILYYVLAVTQNLNLQNDLIRVKCTGTQATSACSLFQKYFPLVQQFTFGDLHRPDFPQTDAADLICVSRCVS